MKNNKGSAPPQLKKHKRNEGERMENTISEMESYRNQIIEEVREIHNVWVLKQIWLMIQNIKR